MTLYADCVYGFFTMHIELLHNNTIVYLLKFIYLQITGIVIVVLFASIFDDNSSMKYYFYAFIMSNKFTQNEHTIMMTV